MYNECNTYLVTLKSKPSINLDHEADDEPLELNETRVEQLAQAGALSHEQPAVLDGVTREPPDISVTLDTIILAFHPGFDFSQLDDWCP